MKTYIHRCLTAAAALGLLFSAGCSDDDKEKTSDGGIVITVDNLTNTSADVTFSPGSGSLHEVRVVARCLLDEFPGDPENPNKIVAYVAGNGRVKTLPYTETVTDIRRSASYIALAVGYSADGQAVCAAYEIYATAAPSGIFSDDGSAGSLDENNW